MTRENTSNNKEDIKNILVSIIKSNGSNCYVFPLSAPWDAPNTNCPDNCPFHTEKEIRWVGHSYYMKDCAVRMSSSKTMIDEAIDKYIELGYGEEELFEELL